MTILDGKEHSAGYAALPENFPNLLQTAQTDDRLFSEHSRHEHFIF
jgi:hypothetical protein